MPKLAATSVAASFFFSKKYRSLPWDRQLRKLKYVLFVLLVVFIPTPFLPNQEAWKPSLLAVKLLGFSTIFLLSLVIKQPFCELTYTLDP